MTIWGSPSDQLPSRHWCLTSRGGQRGPSSSARRRRHAHICQKGSAHAGAAQRAASYSDPCTSCVGSPRPLQLSLCRRLPLLEAFSPFSHTLWGDDSAHYLSSRIICCPTPARFNAQACFAIFRRLQSSRFFAPAGILCVLIQSQRAW